MKRALGYVRLDLRPEIEFQITMHENHYLATDCNCTLPWEACDMVTNVSVIAEIVKLIAEVCNMSFEKSVHCLV